MIEWDHILTAVGTALGGDPVGGRRELLACWERTSDADHAPRCVLAHYLADTESDLDDEVAWDEVALAEFASVSDDELTAIGIPSAAGLAPSLHLNLGDGYLRQGRNADAETELTAGLAAASTLGDDGYGSMIRSGLDGLRVRLEGYSGRRDRPGSDV